MAVAIRRAHDGDQLHSLLGQLVEGALAGVPDARVLTPLADVEETESEWIVEAELPGVKREDINVEVNDNEVVVSGEIKERERVGIVRRRTRPVGKFELRAMLPGEINADGIEASVANGVLAIRVPKAQKANPRRIDVTTA
jgi:HSP20 family protein